MPTQCTVLEQHVDNAEQDLPNAQKKCQECVIHIKFVLSMIIFLLDINFQHKITVHYEVVANRTTLQQNKSVSKHLVHCRVLHQVWKEYYLVKFRKF